MTEDQTIYQAYMNGIFIALGCGVINLGIPFITSLGTIIIGIGILTIILGNKAFPNPLRGMNYHEKKALKRNYQHPKYILIAFFGAIAVTIIFCLNNNIKVEYIIHYSAASACFTAALLSLIYCKKLKLKIKNS